MKETQTGRVLAVTRTVAPISYEMHCDRCHGGNGERGTMTNVLQLHDAREGTDLQSRTPVLCQDCHGDPILNKEGSTGIPNFSLSMHGKHASVSPRPGCYDCHPGPATQCLRTKIEGMQSCEECHGTLDQMKQGLQSGRTPWLQEPKCSKCHHGSEMDTRSTLYRNAKGHHGVACETCHYEPHAWWPSLLGKDNLQPMNLQGNNGPLGLNCLVCHTSVPEEDEGPHGFGPNPSWSVSSGVVPLASGLSLPNLGTPGNPLLASADIVEVRGSDKSAVTLQPSVHVPDDKIGLRVRLYWQLCTVDAAWCSTLQDLGWSIIGSDVTFPIIPSPVNLSQVSGDYLLFVGFAADPDLSDLLYSQYEIRFR